MMKNKIFLIIKNQSQRVRRKNFRNLSGVPLHEYFMRKRGNWEVYIDTDSPEIINFYADKERWANIHVYPRLDAHIKMESEGDLSPAPFMIERFLNEYILNDEEPIVTTHVTSPFIEDATIKSALKKMNSFDSVSSVLPIKEFVVDGVGESASPINFSLEAVVKTQVLNPVGILNGAFFIIRKGIFINNGLRRISDRHYYYPVSQIEGLDIDTDYDFRLAELLAEEMK